MKGIYFFIAGAQLIFPQSIDSTSNSLHSKFNIIKFANHLFCTKDYLRAAEEYLRIDEIDRGEIINFKIGFSFSAIGNFEMAKKFFKKVNSDSWLYHKSRLELIKILFLQENYDEFEKEVKIIKGEGNISDSQSIDKLYNYSLLMLGKLPPDAETFLEPFSSSEKQILLELYNFEFDPPTKNQALSSILSAIIPGAGKFYVGEFTDGLFALISTGLLTYLAYNNFNAGHNFRGWLFAGIAAGFYGGNIYGSYAAAQIHNAKIMYEFRVNLGSFIKLKNYFIPRYDLCEQQF